MRIIELIRAWFSIPSEIIDAVKKIGLDRIMSLMDLPEIENELEVRKWVQLAADIGDEAAEFTKTEVDDFVAEVAQAVVKSDVLWAMTYGLISKALSGEAVTASEDTDLRQAAEDASIDPITIIALVSAIVQLIKLIREFRQKRNA